MNPEIRKIAQWARVNQWIVEDNASGYTEFIRPDGVHVYTYPATPSRPQRRMKELILALRRYGLEWPPPSKSVQRSRRRKEQG